MNTAVLYLLARHLLERDAEDEVSEAAIIHWQRHTACMAQTQWYRVSSGNSKAAV